ncbi:hypothetical protein BTVI_93356 [Pitangus sulphuratus]|nr:hypothetical protein BTVI_93356 [Pitangus sulphuratus]
MSCMMQGKNMEDHVMETLKINAKFRVEGNMSKIRTEKLIAYAVGENGQFANSLRPTKENILIISISALWRFLIVVSGLVVDWLRLASVDVILKINYINPKLDSSIITVYLVERAVGDEDEEG